MTLRISAVAALVLAGCQSGDGPPPQPLPDSGPEGCQNYPAGPYGVNPGSVIGCFEFTGFIDASAESSEDAAVPIALADFYNPTGTDVFPAGVAFPAGEPKPRLLFVNRSAVWCGPCQEEASQSFPGRYAEIQPLGGEFLLILAEDLETNPAVLADLQNWTDGFDTAYPSAIDPDESSGSFADPAVNPVNMLVDTRTMTIIELVIGKPGDSFWDLAKSKLEE